MRRCSRCGREVPADARYCSVCGTEVSSLSELPTEVASPAPPPRSRHSTPSNIGRIESSSGGDFVPGQMLAARYRVIGLLGRGGMGEVYRADDLDLDTPVALKFLPRALSNRVDLLDRLRGEVRNARQVSHPNVCRVYDVGEIDGRAFMTMEYVDGEDLGTLLRRIGRLPRAKADQVARQMCAGLAAAHDRGVIHRDLKPSNIMLDGEGRVRITDFGLAVRGGEGVGEIAGTPAYMAPEQFDGQPATVQSDLYSLGLILYEIHTGQRALEADTWDQWKKKHHSTEPSSPSAIEPEVDEAVSRAILRCLEKDPSRRPASALQLAASLPGGDPLAAALAAGETPSPQMVATAGGEGALPPGRAWAMLGAVAVLLASLLVLSPAASDLGLAPMPSSTPVLQAHAQQIRRSLGWVDATRDQWSDLVRDYPRLKYVADHEISTIGRREFRQRGVPWLFVQRTSPRWLVPSNSFPFPGGEDPPLNVTGMTRTETDVDGRLKEFIAVPPQRAGTPGPGSATTADWTPLFAAASLDTANFVPAAPAWNPPVPFTERVSWVRKSPPGLLDSLHVDAAAWEGRVVWFRVHGPWSSADRDEPTPRSLGQIVASGALGGLVVLMLLAAALLARRHVKAGRSDVRGAKRLLIFVFAVTLGVYLFAGHHVGDAGADSQMFGSSAGEGLAIGALLALFYLAVEPFVRRHTPRLLIGWARLVEGRWRDPGVGRDVLVGAVLGLVMNFLLSFSNALPTWFPLGHQTTVPFDSWFLLGFGHSVGLVLNTVIWALGNGFTVFLAYFVLRMLFRHAGWAALAIVVITSVLAIGGENPVIEVPFAIATGSLMALAIVRFGLLTTLTLIFTFRIVVLAPIVADSSSAAFVPGLIVLGLVFACVLVAFRLSLGQRPVFQLSLDE